MTPKKKKSKEPLDILALKALKAAVKQALRRHEAAGVPAAVWKDGRVVAFPFAKRKNGKAR